MSDEEETRPVGRVEGVGPAKGPEMKVIRLKGSQVMNCIVLSSKLWGFWIHWDHITRRSEPHFENEELCQGCQGKKPKYLKYYLHVFSMTHGQCFVELTEEAARQFQNLLEGEPTYRGQLIEFRRTAANNGRLLCKFSESMAPRANLPKEKDPESTLRLLWQWGRK